MLVVCGTFELVNCFWPTATLLASTTRVPGKNLANYTKQIWHQIVKDKYFTNSRENYNILHRYRIIYAYLTDSPAKSEDGNVKARALICNSIAHNQL